MPGRRIVSIKRLGIPVASVVSGGLYSCSIAGGQGADGSSAVFRCLHTYRTCLYLRTYVPTCAGMHAHAFMCIWLRIRFSSSANRSDYSMHKSISWVGDWGTMASDPRSSKGFPTGPQYGP